MGRVGLFRACICPSTLELYGRGGRYFLGGEGRYLVLEGRNLSVFYGQLLTEGLEFGLVGG
jgi:hypothetical protein